MVLQPPSKTRTIPAEIWIHVAQFIPHADLCSMFSINRIFFELSMDARYRELRFDVDMDAKALCRLQRARDPSIAHRVRSLYVTLTCRRFYEQFDEDSDSSSQTWTRTSLKSLKTMTKTVGFLINVTEFSVKWVYDHTTYYAFSLLLTEAFRAFGSGLHKLSLIVSLKFLPWLLSTVDDLIALRVLDVNFEEDIEEEIVDAYIEVLTTVLAPFINKVATTLHSLSYSTCFPDNMDESQFFDGLVRIPNLERLSISADCYAYAKVLTEPQGIIGFISNHATTLRHLDWNQRFDPSDDPHLMNLSHRYNLEEVFSNLCTLRMPVPGSPRWFSMITQHIKYSAGTLTSLVLFGIMLAEDANSIISLFAPHCGGRLRELSLEVTFLCPELILLLARTLPGLVKLTICANEVAGCEEDRVILETINADVQKSHDLNVIMFADMIRTYDLRGWAIRDIDIGVRSRWDLPDKLMWLLAECVPSVQSFCGKEMEFYELNPQDYLWRNI